MPTGGVDANAYIGTLLHQDTQITGRLKLLSDSTNSYFQAGARCWTLADKTHSSPSPAIFIFYS
jgi:hypothetical protein